MYLGSNGARPKGIDFAGLYRRSARLLLSGRWTVRRRLLVFAVVSLLPVLASAYWVINEGITQAKSNILQESFQDAQSAEFEIRRTIGTIERLLSLIAERPSVAVGDASLTTPLLEQSREVYPELVNIIVTNSSGRVFAAAVWRTTDAPDISDLPYFRYVMQSGGTNISRATFFSKGTNFPTVTIAVPILDHERQPIGVVAGTIGAQYLHMQTTLATMGHVKLRDLSLVDREGRILTNADWRRMEGGAPFPYPEAIAAALNGDRGTSELENSETGEHALVTYVPVAGTPWVLTIVNPMGTIYALAWSAMLRTFVVLLAGFGASAILAFVLLRWISRTIDRLRAKAQKALTSLAGTAVNDDKDELQQLAGAVDSLANLLNSRATQLVELKSELESHSLRSRKLSAKIATVEQDQRRQIATELHDGVAQLVATALLDAQEAERALLTDLETAQVKIRSALEAMRQVSSEVRRDLFELHPQVLRPGDFLAGLSEYFRYYCIVSHLRSEIEISGAPLPLDAAAEQVLNRAVQECLHNVKKHARATRVRCRIAYAASDITIAIEDDGLGFSRDDMSPPPTGHLGLITMEERVRAVGGTVVVTSTQGGGTTVSLCVPLEPEGKLPAGSKRRGTAHRSWTVSV